MREKDYVVIIGSANIDVAGYSHESLNYADSNPCKIKIYARWSRAQYCTKSGVAGEQSTANERSRQ